MTASEVYETASPEATEALGEALSKGFKSGDVIALIGELGAGKTCFVRGAAKGIGAVSRVKSPSFTLVNIYEGGKFALYHLDLYRLSNADEFYNAGLEEYVYARGVCVIEWADKVPALLKDCGVVIRFTHSGEKERVITVERRDE
ncbi:tRNA (adenosine(37)-N6)-threonylcarbamoyltransferase complex ATPase subunit type 1 TsaE [bacterium]|nr:MAG: tRNA (adenosine(37)-N6)-threonylcarbamoyltransferase complex ATPase subunit type 1 TsaE [bacterium]